ncbi:DUF4145 domain-containing protein [Synechococcus elongatus]|uniref:DUF4145 domain-containing protein n=2 Tax=Synechococcus elongatus TaxID=32046 RepID=Q31PC2_SYNE7|nr:DUF4145 domain-containing protein [Synechococcus elongatus]ABB57097.1 conserved hypothetical protein [Synechococcus elongatus PCC 7942 = FACHB-805]AJD58386.1 hypothetical protein M744_11340 [Synechococcus elongatus UTEX 2973]MBD2587498.1 hypothetical protein [Synechococcus elongatus FACHB-242]MBD2688723.1 hypothetical protein [Synechococcus elongatus FACHB-1061]MBD2707794.1 hypothetical protein [Synechococcus elongatus PCC 7942 = FACHB-805]
MTPNFDPTQVATAAQALVLQMMAERGRGVVLVGAARLDLALERLLQSVMAPLGDEEDVLFTPDRSLGSFAAKITLAARLGLLDPTVEKALHGIRAVRNDFAHSASDTNLSEARHQKRLAKSYQAARRNPLWLPLEQVFDEHNVAIGTSDREFILLVTILAAFIDACTSLQTPFRPRATVRFH